MFEFEIDGRQVEAEVSFMTMQIYEAEFGRDIIQDFFGVQTLKEPVDDGADDGVVLRLDFTAINWGAATKALWAAVKTADETTPGYAVWAKSAKGVNFWLVREQLATEMADCFFRAGAAAEEA